MMLAFLMALLVTLNYYDVLMPLMQKIAPKSTISVRLSVSVSAIYCLSFGLLAYPVLALCTDRIALHRAVDRIVGCIVGAMTGVFCCAGLLFIWFSMPFAEASLPVDDSTMFFPCHRMAFEVANVAYKRMQGKQEFDGARFLRDLRYGVPRFSDVGSGFYVTSVPTGLEVYIDTGSGSVDEFWAMVGNRLFKSDLQLRPSERKASFRRGGRTPCLIQTESGKTAWVAVMMEGMPSAIENQPLLERYLPDGEMFVGQKHISDHALHFKIYKVEREGNIATLVSIFEPKDAPADFKMESLMPLKECFILSRGKEEELLLELKDARASADESKAMIRELRLGGKAVFIGKASKPMAVEMTGRNEWRIYEIGLVEDVEEKNKKTRTPKTPPVEKTEEVAPADDLE
jgi:Colicin V production protein